MLKNYLKTAWRNLWKNKGFSAINIVGLAIGMAACIIIMLFVFYERSFDKMHSKNIYRLDEVQKFEGMVAPQNVALSMYPMGPALKNEFREIKTYTRINDFNKVGLNYGDKKVFLPKVFWTDSSFLDVFDFKLISGDRKTALHKPGSVILTQESAAKFFGKENPIGKTLVYYGNDTLSFMVTGLLQDIPKNSHLQFDGLFSFNTWVGPEAMTNWGGNWVVTYLEIDKNADLAALHKKFPAFLKKYMSNENWKHYELFLQPLADVHAKSVDITHDYHNYQKFDSKHTYLFSVIALIVLVIACINFMNLSTAKSAGRAKEVGIRKSVGAERFQLSFQFISESVLLSIIALVLAVLLVQLFLPYVTQLSQRNLEFPLFSDPVLLLAIVGGTIITGIVAGIYPAIYLSSFMPSKVLKGSPQTGRNKATFRNVLVVAQFTCAVFLMIATAFAVKQLQFMQKKDPGFKKDQVVVIPLNSRTNAKYEAIKQEFLKHSAVKSVSASNQRNNYNTSSLVLVDHDFVSLYEIELLAGTNFTKKNLNNRNTYIVNETLAKELLKDNPGAPLQSVVGHRFGFSWVDSLGTIIGVVKDFNFNSLHHKIETLALVHADGMRYSEISVKLAGIEASKAINHLERSWKSISPDQPFEYSFLLNRRQVRRGQDRK